MSIVLLFESKKEKSITLYFIFFLYLYLRTRVRHCSGWVDVRAGRQVRLYMILCKLNKWKCFGIQCTHYYCTMPVLFFTLVWRGNSVEYPRAAYFVVEVRVYACVRRWWYWWYAHSVNICGRAWKLQTNPFFFSSYYNIVHTYIYIYIGIPPVMKYVCCVLCARKRENVLSRTVGILL